MIKSWKVPRKNWFLQKFLKHWNTIRYITLDTTRKLCKLSSYIAGWDQTCTRLFKITKSDLESGWHTSSTIYNCASYLRKHMNVSCYWGVLLGQFPTFTGAAVIFENIDVTVTIQHKLNLLQGEFQNWTFVWNISIKCDFIHRFNMFPKGL